MTEKDYLTEKGLAKRWDVSTSKLQKQRSKNEGPSYVKMGCIRYSLESIKEFEKENTHLIPSASKTPNCNQSKIKEVSNVK